MRKRVALLGGLVACLSGCGALPWHDYGEPDIDCSPWLMPGTELTWAGRGDVVGLGLAVDPDATYSADERDAIIYVGHSDGVEFFDIEPGAHVWCAVDEDHVFLGPAPEGWEPP